MNDGLFLREAVAPDVLLVDTRTLQRITGCGRISATKLGNDAGARVRVGKRLLWNVEKIKKHISLISE